MKTIGLIGGMSWESTAHYYALINKMVNKRFGGNYSAKLLMYSINLEELTQRTFADEWDEAADIMVEAAKRIERGGADFVLIGANTMHIAAEQVEQSINIPLLHIADATADRILAQGLRRVGLMGTAFTMEKGFYKDRLREKFGLEVLVPPPADRKLLHEIVFNELVHGILNPESRAKLRDVITALTTSGAEGIILGCTELPLILEQSDSPVPLFDTTTIHSEAAVERALA